MERIDIRNIQVGGEIGKRIDATINGNILKLNIDQDFMLPFREKWSPDKDELADFVGIGKFLDGLTRMAAYDGQDNLIELKNRIVDEIISMQEKDGYIGMMPPEYRFRTLWDIHEQAFIVLGLACDYRYWKNPNSLAAACLLAGYLMETWRKDPSSLPEIHLATIGLEEALLVLYELTQEKKYIEFLRDYLRFQNKDMDIVIGRREGVYGHIYGYLYWANAQLTLNRMILNPHPAPLASKVLDFMLNKNGMVITGISGEDECFQDNQNGAGNLGETCATAYWMKLLNNLLKCTGDSIYGDLMERSLYNGLFAAQSPEGRQLRYYTAFDGPRRYFHLDVYCCPNNFRRIISELPEMVYYKEADGICVNLYTDSQATFECKQDIMVTIRQETDYPHCGEVRLVVDPSAAAQFKIKLRIPKWCAKAEAFVNGIHVDKEIQPGRFLCIEREWKKEDSVLLKMHMPLRMVKGREMQKGKVAIMRGPVVFCLNRSVNPELNDMDLRLICIDPQSLTESPMGESRLCVNAWPPYRHGPARKPALSLTLTEFTDPNGEAVYFKVPNPNDSAFVDDELFR